MSRHGMDRHDNAKVEQMPEKEDSDRMVSVEDDEGGVMPPFMNLYRVYDQPRSFIASTTRSTATT